MTYWIGRFLQILGFVVALTFLISAPAVPFSLYASACGVILFFVGVFLLDYSNKKEPPK